MKNSELRSLAPVGPKKKAKKADGGGTGGLIAQGAIAFVLAIGGIGLYRNPSLAQGWMPGFGGARTTVARLASPTSLPPGAVAAIADEKAQTKDEPLSMMQEHMQGSAKAFGAITGAEGTAKEQAELTRAFAASTAHINPLMETFGTLEGTNIMTVKLYLGGKTSRVLAETCEASSRPKTGTSVWNDAEALSKFANCYLTTNVERLCSGAQRKVLADVLAFYYANRSYSIKQAEEAGRGERHFEGVKAKPADWATPLARSISGGLRKLVVQGYMTRDDFGWFPEEELKAILNTTAAEGAPCTAGKT